jgi:hypothetical protein
MVRVDILIFPSQLDRKKHYPLPPLKRRILLLEAALSPCLVGLRLVRGVKSGSERASP